MPTPKLTDELAREAWDAFVAHEHNSLAASRSLGLHDNTFRNRIRVARERGFHLPQGIQDAMASVGVNNSGMISGGWLKTKDASIQFRMEKPSIDLMQVSSEIKEALRGIPEAQPSEPRPWFVEDKLTLYPLPDIHAGMRYRGWGLPQAVERLNNVFDHLIGSSFPTHTALIIILGDMLHHNDRTNKTQSGHVLDVDCTPEEAAAAMIASIARGIEVALLKHEEVVVAVLRGNHDRDSYLIVLYSLIERYRKEPRVKINKDDSEFLIFPWEDILIFAHHGDKAKPERLIMWAANEHRELWGKAKHCFLFTGHMHHMKAADINGVQWEQLRAVTPKDDYAISNSYSGRASAVAITYGKGEGEVSRITLSL
jgi:predicted phosphodiesterase